MVSNALQGAAGNGAKCRMISTCIHLDELECIPKYPDMRITDILLWAFRRCVELVSEVLHAKTRAIVLVGSMSRGEATVLANGTRFTCLSDMEFLVVTRNSAYLRHFSRVLPSLSLAVEKELASCGLECKAEFTAVPFSYFQSEHPSIFASEVKHHGKVIWGDSSILRGMPESPVPKTDGLNLICNRIVEQLEWLRTFHQITTENEESHFSYSLVKTYVDLGTSLLIFTGNYAPSYAEREKKLSHLSLSSTVDIPGFNSLLERIREAAEVKLSPPRKLLEPLDRDIAKNRWRELARHVLRVWNWEVTQLVNRPDYSDNMRAWRFAKGPIAWLRIRAWLKLAKIAVLNGNGSDLLRARYFSGIPRNQLYLAAAAQYASLAGLANEFHLSEFATTNTLPIRTPRVIAPDDLTDELIRLWKTYVRNV